MLRASWRSRRVVPSGVEIPRRSGARRSAARALCGRLSPEKGIHDSSPRRRAAARDRRRRPGRRPEAVGFVPHTELGPYYERAAVVCVPSRREGYGVVAREAMAHGRPVVATAVGGLVDVTGVFVPPGDVARLREVLDELLADAGGAHLGAQARETAQAQLSPESAGASLAAAYSGLLSCQASDARSTAAARPRRRRPSPARFAGFGRSSSWGISASRSGLAPSSVRPEPLRSLAARSSRAARGSGRRAQSSPPGRRPSR